MGNRIHVGNLAYSVTDESLKSAFEAFGTVQSAVVVKDKISGRSKGFGFVEMSSEEEANEAIDKINKTQLEGRTVFVSAARSTGPYSSEEGRPAGRPGGGFGGRRHFGGARGGHGGSRFDRDRRRSEENER